MVRIQLYKLLLKVTGIFICGIGVAEGAYRTSTPKACTGLIPVYRSGSNLVVIKTQGVLKGYTGDHYPSHQVEDGNILGHQLIGEATTLVKLQARIVPGCPNKFDAVE